MRVKVVPSGLRCYDPGQLGALFVLARGQLERPQTIDDVLRWDEN